MKYLLSILFFFTVIFGGFGQNKYKPTDYLSADFHTERRAALRDLLPRNSVAVFFANAIRNRSNDVAYRYHQDPDFYYLTGYKEPHTMLLVFSEPQVIHGVEVNDLVIVQQKDAQKELWLGERLGIKGGEDDLGFKLALTGYDLLEGIIDFSRFSHVLFKPFQNDVRDTGDEVDLYNLISTFKKQMKQQKTIAFDKNGMLKKERLESGMLLGYMASLREIKTAEELVLLIKAIKISAIGQIEMMKAMHQDMSETEVQGIHEFVYKKYGAEYEGYPSIVGAGNNGCVLHYIENNKTNIKNQLVLMDLGAEYHGYTADVTRTIPANGKFTKEQKSIYDLVYKAQTAGIAKVQVGNPFSAPDHAARTIIAKGLISLGIIKNMMDSRQYFPHGSSHYIGLDVHDTGNFGPFKENQIITVEPGIYIPYNSPCDSKWWGIAVRIEDDILITKNGPVNVSGAAPRTSDAIEKMMQQPSVLDGFVLPVLD
ncbi:MAG: Xaa-Pro aminopeptidase [Flavobacteriaceae bacterium]|nr:MAG: Xaa-Pro aminopeptidase [Flavobacteriaceae bacterium]